MPLQTARLLRATCLGLLLPCLAAPLLAQEFDEQFDLWPVDLRINGTILVANSLEDRAEVDELFLRASGGEEAKIVGLFWRIGGAEDTALTAERLKAAAEVKLLQAAEASGEIEELTTASIASASGVILHADETLLATARQQLTGLRTQLKEVINRGGAIYATGQAGKMLSAIEIVGGEQLAQVDRGLDLIPNSVLESQFSAPQDTLRLKSVLVSHPRSVGIGVPTNTAVILRGRHLMAAGGGQVTVMIAANEREPFRVRKIGERTSRRQRPSEYLIDLTQWRREAIDRTVAPFPVAEPETPFVRNGALVIAGGGGLPEEVMERFIDLAGGVDQARLVYVPCSERRIVSERQGIVEAWRKRGVKHATFIHTKDRLRANGDPEFYAPLEQATGIWFGGGRQWNFADSYYGTKTHELMKRVVRMGGVVGGSSAGASVQARYMARATPIENLDIMAPGYERGGLGFISGVAIDQHFTQRGRQKDMTQLVNRYPQLLGIGIDEGTALIVQGSLGSVLGKGQVHFYDRNLPVIPGQDDFVALPAGARYDLAARKVVQPGN